MIPPSYRTVIGGGAAEAPEPASENPGCAELNDRWAARPRTTPDCTEAGKPGGLDPSTHEASDVTAEGRDAVQIHVGRDSCQRPDDAVGTARVTDASSARRALRRWSAHGWCTHS